MAANLNELSYNGGAGDFVEIRVTAGTDVSDLDLEVYVKAGPRARLGATYGVSSGTFSSDGTYDYYVLSVPLEKGPRAGIALSENGIAIDSVFWGPTSPVAVSNGSLSGSSQASIGTPLSNNSTNSLVPDGTGNWILNIPTVGTFNFPCFTRDTCLRTPIGEVPVQALAIGDLVETLDHGYQPIRWIGSNTVSGRGELAPVVIKKGALENRHRLAVSPQHRFLLQGWKCELLFGQDEVLVSAKSLIDNVTIYQKPCETVEYFHLLFDQHEVIFAEGIATESFHPGDFIMGAMSVETQQEIYAIFPELADGMQGYSETARTALRMYEGRLLVA